MLGGVAAWDVGAANRERSDTDIIAIQAWAEIEVRFSILVLWLEIRTSFLNEGWILEGATCSNPLFKNCLRVYGLLQSCFDVTRRSVEIRKQWAVFEIPWVALFYVTAVRTLITLSRDLLCQRGVCAALLVVCEKS